MNASPSSLPRGRHGLSREQVVAVQRERILRAMAEAMGEKGYAGTTVADVIRAAGVSRETFYQQFASKQDCFMAAYDEATRLILSRIPGPPGGGDPVEAFERGIAAYLEALAGEPQFARLFLVDVYAAGEEAIARRMQAQAAFAAVLEQAFAPRDETARFAIEALVAAISSMVTARLAQGDAASLPQLREPLTALVRRALAA